jgi:hypothetical protein
LIAAGYHIRKAQVTQIAAQAVADRRQPVAPSETVCASLGEQDRWTLRPKWSKL